MRGTTPVRQALMQNVAEIVGIFLVIVGCFGIVVAAALVSTALAACAASLLVLLAGVLVVYLANAAAARAEVEKQQRQG